MRRLADVELLKLTTIGVVRLFVVLAAVVVIVSTISAVAAVDADRPRPILSGEGFRVHGEPPAEPAERMREDARRAVGIWSYVTLVVLALGIVAAGSEWRHGTLGAAVLAVPKRRRLVLAKVMTVVRVGIVIAAVGLALNALIALPWLESKSATTGLAAHEWVLLVAGGAVATILAAGLGVAVGLLFAAPATGIVATIGFLLLVEPVLVARAPELAQWLPGHAIEACFRGVPYLANGDVLPQGVGVLVLATWALGLLAIAARTLSRRDLA